MPQSRKISQRRALRVPRGRFRNKPSTESGGIPKRGRHAAGTGGRHPSESLVGMGWIMQIPF